jgi:hypothetical protein
MRKARFKDETMNNQAYEDRLGDALEKVMEQGATELPALAEGLNSLGVTSLDGKAWTAQTLEAEFHRLGEAARAWERERTQ